MSVYVPGSPEWLGVMSASKTAAVLGVSPWQSPWSLWQVMKGLVEPEPESDVMRRGTLLEPAVLAWWRTQHPGLRQYMEQYQGWLIDQGDSGPWGMSTSDALAVLEDGTTALVEAKTTIRWDEWGEAGTDAVPAHYYAQCLWQLACIPDASRVHVPVLGPYLDWREYVVERDDELIDDLVDRCREFYDSLTGDEPPALDGHRATLATLRRAHPDIERGETAIISDEAAAEYVAAELALSVAEERSRAARAVILDAAGDAQYIDTPDGQRVARRQASGRGVALRRVAATITTGGHHE